MQNSTVDWSKSMDRVSLTSYLNKKRLFSNQTDNSMKKKSKNTMKYPPGTKINFLTILAYLPNEKPKKVICRCDCGMEKSFYLSNILPKKSARYTKSCGCMRAGLVSNKNSTHGLSGGKFYKRWRSMHDRTTPSYINAAAYVGVEVCARWHSFELFKEDMYESWLEHTKEYGQRDTTLDRIDVLRSYEPNNCRWATRREQSRNKKDTVFVQYDGKKVPLIDLCEELSVLYPTVRARLKRGYTIEQALTHSPWERRKIDSMNTKK